MSAAGHNPRYTVTPVSSAEIDLLWAKIPAQPNTW